MIHIQAHITGSLNLPDIFSKVPKLQILSGQYPRLSINIDSKSPTIRLCPFIPRSLYHYFYQRRYKSRNCSRVIIPGAADAFFTTPLDLVLTIFDAQQGSVPFWPEWSPIRSDTPPAVPAIEWQRDVWEVHGLSNGQFHGSNSQNFVLSPFWSYGRGAQNYIMSYGQFQADAGTCLYQNC